MKNMAIITISSFALLSCSGGMGTFSLPNPFAPSPNAVAAEGQIVNRGSYRAIITQNGDNIASLAAKSGVDEAAFRQFNGLPERYTPYPGEEFAIPPNASPNFGQNAQNPLGVMPNMPNMPADSQAISGFGGSVNSTISSTSLGSSQNTAQNVNLINHTVQAGETAFSIARQYNTNISQLTLYNNMSADMSLTPGQVIRVPAASGQAASANATPSAPTQTNTASTAQANAQSSTASADSGFIQPVSGTIKEDYNTQNKGIVFSTAPQAPVRAAASGEVVLTSQSAGSTGSVVMIKHSQGLVTVYARLGSIAVTKGQTVSAGQNIGTTQSDSMLLQLRRGSQSLNPVDYF